MAASIYGLLNNLFLSTLAMQSVLVPLSISLSAHLNG
jgi:hypothetical protein